MPPTPRWFLSGKDEMNRPYHTTTTYSSETSEAAPLSYERLLEAQRLCRKQITKKEMSKFKKGDKVRITRGTSVSLGKRATVEQDYSSCPYIIVDGKDYMNEPLDCELECDLELVEEVKQYKFKIGEEVREEENKDYLGVIEYRQDGRYQIRGRRGWWTEDYIELVYKYKVGDMVTVVNEIDRDGNPQKPKYINMQGVIVKIRDDFFSYKVEMPGVGTVDFNHTELINRKEEYSKPSTADDITEPGMVIRNFYFDDSKPMFSTSISDGINHNTHTVGGAVSGTGAGNLTFWDGSTSERTLVHDGTSSVSYDEAEPMPDESPPDNPFARLYQS